MKKLDKLISQVKQINTETQPRVHIIENNYCYSCKGKCKYKDNNQRLDIGEGIVVVYGDLPNNTNGFADAPKDTLIKIAKYEE